MKREEQLTAKANLWAAIEELEEIRQAKRRAVTKQEYRDLDIRGEDAFNRYIAAKAVYDAVVPQLPNV